MSPVLRCCCQRSIKLLQCIYGQYRVFQNEQNVKLSAKDPDAVWKKENCAGILKPHCKTEKHVEKRRRRRGQTF